MNTPPRPKAKPSPAATRGKVPRYFGPILWSYDLATLDLRRDKKTIIIQTINYGDLKHWRWISQHYGRTTVRRVLSQVPVTELRERVRPLAATVWKVQQFSHAPRGPRRKTA